MYGSVHRKALSDAIYSALARNELKRVVDQELDESLEGIVERGPYQSEVADLVAWANRKGRFDELASAVIREAPRNSKLADFAATIAIAAIDQAVTDVGTKHGFDFRDSNPNSALEAVIRKRFPSVSYSDWLSKLAQAQGAICLIEMTFSDGVTVGGSGFSVGTTSILTNYHVVERAIRQPKKVTAIKATFDWVNSAEPHEEQLNVSDIHEWLVAYSPFEPGEPFADGRPTDTEALDFALLRVGGKQLKFLSLKNGSTVPSNNDILFILQHPDFRQLEIAVGAITGWNSNKTRVRYDTNSDEGSSGSPCLDANLSLVALHHAGVGTGLIGKLKGEQSFNQGVPITLIRRSIEKSGNAAFDSNGGIILTKEVLSTSPTKKTGSSRMEKAEHSSIGDIVKSANSTEAVEFIKKCKWDVIDFHVVPNKLIHSVARALPAVEQKQQVLNEANSLRTEADSGFEPSGLILDQSSLPPILVAPDLTFWTTVFHSACARGGRSLSSLLLSLPMQIKNTHTGLIEAILKDCYRST